MDQPLKFGFIPIEGGAYYPEFLEEVLLGEQLGFDSVWLEEHHGIRDHYWPSPLVGLAGLATRTEHILFGTDIIVLPFYHPVRLAEDAAMLDIMSQGRFILGAAIGYKPDEFALYQVLMENRGARFEEAIQLIKLLWTQGEVNFKGKNYQVQGLKIEPRPMHHLPLWMGGWGDLSLERAARLGDAWVPGPTADLGNCSARKKVQWNFGAAECRPKLQTKPLTREVVIAETDALGARWRKTSHDPVTRRIWWRKWKHPLIGSAGTPPWINSRLLVRDRFIVCSPETVIRQIQRFQETFGTDHLICRLYFPGLPHSFIMNEIHLLAKEVLPVFQKVVP
jgi:alkanesulfonate monooxygenase SsuD/methylene tetrahydromethanopterin reductase-like flavin-dependent oxidoreductase (luciferase family)